MTPQPQPHPQFIATDEDLRILEQILGYKSDAINRIRSRPFPAPAAVAQQRIEHTGKLYIEVDHGKVKCTDGKYHDFQEYFYLFDVVVGDTIALLQAGDQHD